MPPQPTAEVPESALSAARAAFDLRVPGATIAEQVPEQIMSRVRSLHVRRLSFTGRDILIWVDVHRCGDELRLEVGVLPPRVLTVEVRHRGEPLFCASDPTGHCVLEPVQHGPVSLLLIGGVPRTTTAWVLL